MSLETVKTELQKIDSVLVTARRLLAEGKSVDLSSIEDKVRTICALAEAVDESERPVFLEILERLMQELDAISEEIENKHRDILGTMEGRTASGAAQAYGSARDLDQSEETES